jgi:methylphosphotriester-DNA--protein-cysteine methyltransferase
MPARAAPELPPKLCVWGARTLFLGQALGLSAHRNAVAVLCAGIDGSFAVASDPKRPEAGYMTCRTALIPANTLHHLNCGPGTMAFLYVDARSDDFRRLNASMQRTCNGIGLQLTTEAAYLDQLIALRDGAPWRDARRAIATTLGLGAATREDERIATTLRALREQPGEPHPLDEVAQRVRLSPSRFLHLFKASTGVPFRRYKMWIRMGAAIHSMGAGLPLTEAALAAGFSSSSHFSAAFREMFGLPPSQLAASRLTIQDGRAR